MGKKKCRDKNVEKMKHKKWVICIFILTIFFSIFISTVSEMLLKDARLLVAFVILIAIITMGVLFDILGTAVTAASEVPFHAMASKKIAGAKMAVRMVRNADKVSNFCNDVIGDICGIVSGAAGLIIVSKIVLLIQNGSFYEGILASIISALTAGITIGGKALGKNMAIKHSEKIVFGVSKIIHIIIKE